MHKYRVMKAVAIFGLLAAAACATVGFSCGPKEDSTYQPTWPDPPEDAVLAGLTDPFIGTLGEGQTFPGAMVPWGMASPSPHTTLTDPVTFLNGLVANGGYIHGEPMIYGFGQTHLNGVGCPDLGAVVLMPTVGDVEPYWENYGATYEDERAYAGYYAVKLTNPDIYVEVTATRRTGLYRIWFPKRSGDANVLIDVGRSISWRENDGTVRIVSGSEVEGSVTTGSFCGERNRPTVYFTARFSTAARDMGTWTGTTLSDDLSADGRAGAFMRFSTRAGDPVLVAVGLSYVSVENARENLAAEVGDPGRLGETEFDDARQTATRAWQTELGRIRVEGGTESDRVRFFTALYHALLQPNVFSDTNGEYPADGSVAVAANGERYTVLSLWDTYRTLHPLLTLVYPERQLDMLRTIEDLTVRWDRPPQWELIGEEVQMMVGDAAAIVVADSYFKGITDFDVESVYQIMKTASEDPDHRPGATSYLALGYVPMEEHVQVWGPASTTLEYALADSALALLADALGHTADASALSARARNYALLYDDVTGTLRPKNADGTFLDPFDPDELEGSSFQPRAGGPGYVEGTAWHYAFFVPHDMEGLIALHTDALFIDRLQSVFDTDRFAMWNEPDMAYPYLFNYVDGQAHRTQEAVRAAMDRFFTDGPDGLPGNDDTGTLSAWFVFSAMGFYPDAPGTPRYALGSPIFDLIEITLTPGFHTGSSFVIEAVNNGPDRPYVVSAELNGIPLDHPFILHDDITAGGVLTLHMSDTPAP